MARWLPKIFVLFTMEQRTISFACDLAQIAGIVPGRHVSMTSAWPVTELNTSAAKV